MVLIKLRISQKVTVEIQKSNAVLLKGMEGSRLGIWASHGEGQVYFPNEKLLEEVLQNNLAPVRYIDENNEISEVYPYNPNGSLLGIAGLCSPCGRHLGLMPHVERSFHSWQWPYMPVDMRKKSIQKFSPWIKFFINALLFCEESM